MPTKEDKVELVFAHPNSATNADVRAFKVLITASLPDILKGAKISFLTEPLAIAVSYGITPADGSVCIVDIGAGTTDILVAKMSADGKLTTLRYANGDACTGNRLTEAIIGFVKQAFFGTPSMDFDLAEKLKLRACTCTVSTIINFQTVMSAECAGLIGSRKDGVNNSMITRAEFDALVSVETNRLPTLLESVRAANPNVVVLSGGPTHMGVVCDKVRTTLVGAELRSSPDRFRAVARGACMYVVRNVVDAIIPFDIAYTFIPSGGALSLGCLVPANSPLPFSASLDAKTGPGGKLEIIMGSIFPPGKNKIVFKEVHDALKVETVSLSSGAFIPVKANVDIKICVDIVKAVTVEIDVPEVSGKHTVKFTADDHVKPKRARM